MVNLGSSRVSIFDIGLGNSELLRRFAISVESRVTFGEGDQVLYKIITCHLPRCDEAGSCGLAVQCLGLRRCVERGSFPRRLSSLKVDSTRCSRVTVRV